MRHILPELGRLGKAKSNNDVYEYVMYKTRCEDVQGELYQELQVGREVLCT